MKMAATVAVASLLSGCGTYVPYLQDASSSPGDEQLLVQAIVTSINCDISNAVRDFIDSDVEFKSRNRGSRSGEWLDSWGAQVALTLAVAEKTSINPTIVGSPVNSIFSISAGLTASSESTRTNKLNFFYTVKDLYKKAYCKTGNQPRRGLPSPLIQNDLKIGNWLFSQLAPAGTGEVVYPVSAKNVSGQNVLSHEVKFQVITEGGITPTWKLIDASINPSGAFFEAGRDRTSDVIVTFGPLDPNQDNRGLIPQAENVHFVQQLGLANSTNSAAFIIRRPLF